MPAEYKLAVRDGARVREVLLVGTVTVGRSPACEISSPDPRLSRNHASFDVVGGEVVVRDLGSSNGTTVNGQPITEHRLLAGEQVEVGPFVVQLVDNAPAVVQRRPVAGPHAEDATVMTPLQQHAPVSAGSPAVSPATPAADALDDSSSRTRVMQRSDLAAAADVPAAAPAPPKATPPHVAPPNTAPPASTAPSANEIPTAPAAVRAPGTDLTFGNVALLWIVPVVLISFLAGVVPDLMQPDPRPPLLRAYYLALATSAGDLVKMSREPAVPIDMVTTALRRHAAVTATRVIGADGRVLAPLNQAGTTVSAPVVTAEPAIIEARDGTVEVQVSGQTGDGRPVMVSMTVDPERVHPSAPGSVLSTLLLILSLGAAWLVARRLTSITDTRLSRLGEEIELMTTRQIAVGRDPFSLKGGTRILDAVTFALSSMGRVAGRGSLAAQRHDLAAGDGPATASIDADSAFRIVRLDAGCAALLGVNVHDAPGTHLIEALPDQAVSNEVMRLLTIASAGETVSGEAISADGGLRLGIDVTKGAGAAPLSIRFRRL